MTDPTTSQGGHLAIIGAGLSGLMTAWRVATLNPDIRITVYEASGEIAGDHTWSFNDSDIAPHLREWIAPFVRHSWPRYDVQFPKRRRTLQIGYRTGDSEMLRCAIQPYRENGHIQIVTGRAVTPEQVTADAVIDARGFVDRDDTLLGYQKFVGHVIRTQAGHGLSRPVIMDATVAQIDGYRFLYLLPFTDHELLVEDTYFSDNPHLSENEISARIADYIRTNGWEKHELLRTEKGVLPMTTATSRTDNSTEIGLRGGFVVSATGFTMPHAVEVADTIAQAIRTGGLSDVPRAITELRAEHIRRERFPRLLNRMFFRAGDPAKRYQMLQRFYGFREGLIRRFYANRLTGWDKLRILSGKPPVPVTKALYNFSEKAFMARHNTSSTSENESP